MVLLLEESKCHEGKELCVYISLIYLHHLEQCLIHNLQIFIAIVEAPESLFISS